MYPHCLAGDVVEEVLVDHKSFREFIPYPLRVTVDQEGIDDVYKKPDDGDFIQEASQVPLYRIIHGDGLEILSDNDEDESHLSHGLLLCALHVDEIGNADHN